MSIKFKKFLKIITYMVVILIFLAIDCIPKNRENCHGTISFKNNSSKTLYVASYYYYPDTTTLIISNPVSSDNTNKVLPFSENKTALWEYGCFEDLLQSLKKDTLFVYVFDAEIVETTPWDTVLANNLILKRYDLSLEDLQNMNWTIIYP